MLGSIDDARDLSDEFESKFVSVGDVRLHAVVGGSGPPLLLVHGWPQNWYAWRLVMPSLARQFTVIAISASATRFPARRW